MTSIQSLNVSSAPAGFKGITEKEITARNWAVTRSFVAGCTRLELATSDVTVARISVEQE